MSEIKYDELKYDEKGLIPAIIQQFDTGEVLMMAYMNAESLQRTLETGTTWFWKRSSQRYWNKGATSGRIQKVIDLRYDCDGDCLLVLADCQGPACHTDNRSCFYRSLL
jgi:phosphoribosyl-AMP cyclohydrolase